MVTQLLKMQVGINIVVKNTKIYEILSKLKIYSTLINCPKNPVNL
jgi:hypothetical protein